MADEAILTQLARLPAREAKQKLLSFVEVLLGDLRCVERELKVAAPKAAKLDRVQELLDEQARAEARYNSLERQLTKLIGKAKGLGGSDHDDGK